MATPTSFLDLPLDVLFVIFPYLDAHDFLNLTSTCKDLHDSTIRDHSAYWGYATRSKFRVRNRLAVQQDGFHWRRLYRRLLTQSRVFTWGQNTWGCLGQDAHETRVAPPRHPQPQFRLGPGDRRRGFGRGGLAQVQRPVAQRSLDVPAEMAHAHEVGIIADLQCGGWSTSILNDKGVIHTVGVLDATKVPQPREGILRPLRFPAGYPQAGERYEPATAIRSFSSGRSHVLGLSDTGIIWSWYDAEIPCVKITFADIELHENADQSHSGGGYVREVVAGWDKSAAYVTGSGIVVWDILQRRRVQDGVPESDTLVLVQHRAIPRTAYIRPRKGQREDPQTAALGEEVGQVRTFISLEGYIVFVTDLGKVFASRLSKDSDAGFIFDTFELTEFDTSTTSEIEPATIATDVQGSFQSFAVFRSDGSIFKGNTEYLEYKHKQASLFAVDPVPNPIVIPALQNTGVIQVAFGDYHFHALHSEGHITSYGYEPQSIGALGLGSVDAVAHDIRFHVRGLYNVDDWGGSDFALCPHAYASGRRIWFQPEKKEWLDSLSAQTANDSESMARMAMLHHNKVALGEIGEWVEEQSRDWDRRPGVKEKDIDGLGAHFALSVAAAGWHSGALVLVNKDLEEAVKQSCIQPSAPVETQETTEAQPESSSAQPTEDTVYSRITGFVQRIRSMSLSANPEETDDGTESEPRWTWVGQKLPRLRLSSGEVMPGTDEVSEWRSSHADWFAKLKYNPVTQSVNVFNVKGWSVAE